MSTLHLPPELAPISRLVAEHAGLSLDRAEDVERGIRRAMQTAGHDDPTEYFFHLRQDRETLSALVEELTVGETYFFREPLQFEVMERSVLPALLRGRDPHHPLRAWSVGCATGEEPYSLAILLERMGLGERAEILATDLSRPALTLARAARFRAWSLRGVPGDTTSAWFEQDGDLWVLDDVVRRRVRFRQLNLAAEPWPRQELGLEGLDLVLCRNVLIYLAPEVAHRVARALVQSLAVGGYLFLAAIDPLLSHELDVEPVRDACGVFYRRAGAALPWSRSRSSRPPPPRAPSDESADRSGVCERVFPLNAGIVERVLELVAARDFVAASSLIDEGLAVAPTAAALLHLRGLLLADGGHEAEAVADLRRALYSDPDQVASHFLLGALLRRRGDRAGAAHEYRAAGDACRRLPVDAVVPLSEGERAGVLREVARREADRLFFEGDLRT